MPTGVLSFSRRSLQVIRRMKSQWNSISISSKIPTLLSATDSITIGESAQQENIIKDLQLYIKSKKDETISEKKICTEYIKNLSRSGRLPDVVQILRHLHTRDIKVCLNTYNFLLADAIEMNNFTLVSELFKSMLMFKVPPDIISYNKVAEALEKVSDSDAVLNFIKDVSVIASCTDCAVINRIIYVTAKFGRIDISLMIFEALKDLHLKMDTVTFNTVLWILGKSGRISEMLSTFMVMKDLGNIPDIITYSTLINCFRRFGRLDLCKTITSEISEKGIQLDLLTYTALIDAFGRAGKVEEALRLFEEMKKFQNPSIYVYRSIISVLKKVGNFEQALRLSSEMNSSATRLAGPEDFKQRRRH